MVHDPHRHQLEEVQNFKETEFGFQKLNYSSQGVFFHSDKSLDKWWSFLDFFLMQQGLLINKYMYFNVKWKVFLFEPRPQEIYLLLPEQ